MDPKLIAEGIVDADIDAPELLHGGGHRGRDRIRVADIPDDRQCLAAGFLEFLGGREHRAWQLWMRLGGLGDQGNVGAVARGPLGDRKADTATGARDEHGLAVE